MSFKLEKSMRIIDELAGFCCRRGCNDIKISYNTEDVTKTVITISAKNTTITDAEMETLKSQLSQHRQREMEECYWQITGDDSFGDELSLIGVMVDDCEIDYVDKVLNITVYRVEK